MAFSPVQNIPFTQTLTRSHLQLWDYTSTWRTTGESLRKLILPNHAEIDTITRTKGDERTDDVYSSTATIAAPRLASHLSGNVTPSKHQWFDFEDPATDIQDIEEDDTDWLQDEAHKLYASIQTSNFGGERLKAWLELLVYGTSAVMSDEHPFTPGEFIFHTVPYGTFAIEEEIDGTLMRFDRRFEWSLSKIASKWGLEKLSTNWQGQHKSNPFVNVEVVQIIRKAQASDYAQGIPRNMKFASYYLDRHNNHILEVGGFPEMPVHIARWCQAAGETLGRGPGHDVLADIRSDNEIARLGLNNLALNVLPPMIGRHEGVLEQPVIRPASMMWVMEQGDLQPWQNGARLDIQQYGQVQLKQSIERAFFQDLLNVTQQQPQGKTPISATQINTNIDRMLPIIGPFLDKMEHEDLVPMLNRLFGIKQRKGLVSPPPPGLLDRLGGKINVSIKGPIAKATQRVKLESMDAMVTRLNQVSPIWPDAAKMLNVPRTVRLWALGENAPIEMLNSKDELEQLQQQEQQALQEAQQNQEALDASQVIKNTQGATGDQPQQ